MTLYITPYKISLFLCYIGTFLLCIGCKSNENTDKIEDQEHIDIVGLWNHDCADEHAYIALSKHDSIALEINANRVFIVGTFTPQKETNTYNVNYSYANISNGGMGLDWEHFEKDSIVARLHFKDSTHAQIHWLGFYNTKTKQREWVHKSDFKGPLVKCDFE